ncbi:MAG: T9SS type A sorting domain-containing protein [Bacteroidetes bacterium]|nr:T9SS type A sorting domain-containing protein [Bacteroidota bacterium]
MNKIFTLFLFLSFSIGVFAQQERVCGYDHYVRSLAEEYPGFEEAYKTTFEQAQRFGEEQSEAARSVVLTIPVVFHVVWNTNRPVENLSDAIIQEQLDVLNADFRKLNADAVNIRPEFAGITGDAMVEFEIAEIIRVETTRNFTNIDHIKKTAQGGSDALDPSRHLNIWIAKLPGLFGGQLLGIAYPPAGLSNWPIGSSAPSPEVDGVAVDYRTVGLNNPDPFYEGVNGRTCVHETGHYLGLRHIWGDAIPIFQDGCQVDDGVADTPKQRDKYQTLGSCPSATATSCLTHDMWENFMDYTGDACQIAFTEGQINIIRGVLEGPRAGLVSTPLGSNLLERKEFNVYPNPVYNGFAKFYSSELPNSLEIYDVVGKRVYMNNTITSGQELDLSGMQKGIYLISASFDDGKATQKIIIK